VSTTEHLVEEYLHRLGRAAAGLPADRRAELLEGIGEHIASAQPRDEAEARTLLDRLGEPEEIVAAAREDLPALGWGPPSPGWGPSAPGWAPPATARGTGLELAAVLMLTLGSLVPVVGWLVGVVLLWTSSLWRVREKVLGTLVVPLGPGGLLVLGAFVPLFGTTQSCTSTISGSVPLGGPGAPPVPPPPVPPPPAPAPPGAGVDDPLACTTSSVGPGWVGPAVAVLLVVASLAVAVLLLRVARRRAAEQPVVGAPYALAPAASPWGGLELAGVLVLGLGGFLVPVVGPLVGLALVAASSRWTRAQKLIAAGLCVLPLLYPLAMFALRVLGDRILL
jgi:hypothetical protein